MKHHDLTNWKGYGRPDNKLTLRHAPDAQTVAASMVYNFHDDVAEYMLRTHGVMPDLLAYIVGIGRAYR